MISIARTFGAPLTVDLTTDATGTLMNVTVNPADGLTATSLKPNSVQFQTASGTAFITVINHEGRQSTTVRAGSLADISGNGEWKGDVFGTGQTTTVGYTIGANSDGSPNISSVTSSDATAQIGALDSSNEDGEQTARVRIAFANATAIGPFIYPLI